MKRDELRAALRLYAVTDRAWLQGKPLADQVERALAGGVTMVQLREKELPGQAFLAEAVTIREVCRRYGAPFLVNDNVQAALAAGADGAHIGQEDLPAREARKLLGPGKILGVSASTVEEALEAQRAGADYLGVGAVFPTSTKGDADPVSMEMLRKICRAASIPVVAIGGITAENAWELKGTGIAGLAVVSALFAQRDIAAAAGTLLEIAGGIVKGGGQSPQGHWEAGND